MSDFAPQSIGRTTPAAADYTPAAARPAVTPRATRGADRVELSTAATLLSRLADLPDIRFELVASVKQQIQSGTYETPEKLDAAIDGLLADLA